MARGNERSLSNLKEDAERNRAELTETVDQLRSKVADTVTDFRKRVSPDAVKEDVREYFHAKADALIDKARENPLQAAAIGIGVGYPLFRIARAIPAPVLMVGAGLYLLGTSAGQKATGDATRKLGAVADDVSDRFGAALDAVARKANDVRDTASVGLASASDAVSSGLANVTDRTSAASATLKRSAASLAGAAANSATSLAESASDGIAGLKQEATGAVSAASDGIAKLKEQAVGAVGATSEAVRGSGAATGALVRDTASSAADFGTGAALQLRDRAVDTSQKAASAINGAIQQNPLLVGGLGLALGMLIASALPKSDIEKTLMGSAGAEARKRASALAATGLETAKGIASGAIADLVDHAGQENLTPKDLSAAAEDIGRRVRKVAESATQAAFGDADETTHNAA